ncbi:MAG: YceI family protein [Bacteroidetes bacterium]|nr:YceI family protein [Bacteroidota bacterium]
MKKSLLSLVFAAAMIVQANTQTNWVLDKTHSNIGFTVKHMVIAEVSGSFRDSEVKVSSTTEDFNGATIEFVAKTASIDTQNEMRDGHLKGDDFFNAEKYPEIKFSGKLVKKGKDYSAVGKLTLRDVTKDVTLPVTYLGTVKTAQFTKAGFKINGSINRFDYNLKWNKTIETGGMVVGEEVQLGANIELNLAK